MDNEFDALARRLSGALTRRDALRRLSVGLGALLGSVVLPGWAPRPEVVVQQQEPRDPPCVEGQTRIPCAGGRPRCCPPGLVCCGLDCCVPGAFCCGRQCCDGICLAGLCVRIPKL